MGNAQSGKDARPGLAGSESDDDVQDLGQFWTAEGLAHGAPIDSDDENVVVSLIHLFGLTMRAAPNPLPSKQSGALSVRQSDGGSCRMSPIERARTWVHFKARMPGRCK